MYPKTVTIMKRKTLSSNGPSFLNSTQSENLTYGKIGNIKNRIFLREVYNITPQRLRNNESQMHCFKNYRRNLQNTENQGLN